MTWTSPEGETTEISDEITNLEKAWIAIAKFIVTKTKDETFTEREVREWADLPVKAIHDGIRRFIVWEILVQAKMIPGEAYQYKIKDDIEERDQNLVKELSQGYIRTKIRTRKPVLSGDGASTSDLVLRALSTLDAKAFTIPSLAHCLERSEISVRKIIESGVNVGFYERMDDHDKATKRGRSPNFYFITPRGITQYARVLGKMSPEERSAFLESAPSQMLRLSNRGQYKNIDDEPTGMDMKEFEYIRKHGTLPPVSDDDEIPM